MGDLARGALAHRGTVTTTGNGTALNLGALEDGERMYGNLHLTSASAGDTLDVVVESDDAEAFTTPTTRITFAQASAVGAQRLSVAGPVTDSWWRVKRTVGGTDPSFGFAVGLGRSGVAAVVPPSADAHLALIDDLGGDSVVLGFYCTTDGETGLADPSVIHSGGRVTEWWDYRSESSHGPKLVSSGDQRPDWNATDLRIEGNGAAGSGMVMLTAAEPDYDLDTPKSIAVVAIMPTPDEFVCDIADVASAANRLLGIDRAVGGTSAVRGRFFPGGDTVATGATTDGTEMLVALVGHNGTTTGYAEVPNVAQGSGAITALPTGSVWLGLFGYAVTTGSKSASKARALIVLDRAFTASDKNFIRDWAIAEHSAVLK